MQRFVVALLTSIILLPAVAGDKLTAPIALFDGKTLDTWDFFLVNPKMRKTDVWSVRDGILICKGKPMGYLCTKTTYTNFKLVVEWRWPEGVKPTNSGVFLRITGNPMKLPKCMEAQLKHGSAGDIMAFHGFRVTGDPKRSRTSQNKAVGKMIAVRKIRDAEGKPGTWNKYEITVNGGTVTAVVNGVKVNEVTNADVVAGKIALQSEGGEIHFRTVELTPLP